MRFQTSLKCCLHDSKMLNCRNLLSQMLAVVSNVKFPLLCSFKRLSNVAVVNLKCSTTDISSRKWCPVQTQLFCFSFCNSFCPSFRRRFSRSLCLSCCLRFCRRSLCPSFCLGFCLSFCVRFCRSCCLGFCRSFCLIFCLSFCLGFHSSFCRRGCLTPALPCALQVSP